MNPPHNIVDYVTNLMKLLSHEAGGTSESDEAYVLREKMIEPWYALTDEERALADKLAEIYKNDSLSNTPT
jgi:hypothetical protein